MDHSPRYRQFRALLREIREEAGLHQAVLGKKLGRAQKTISKIELGERSIEFLEAVDFCLACGVPVSRFLKRLEGALVSSPEEGVTRRNPSRPGGKGRSTKKSNG